MYTKSISIKKTILAMSLLASFSAFSTNPATTTSTNASTAMHIAQIEHGLDIESVRFDADKKRIYLKVNIINQSSDFQLMVHSGFDNLLGYANNSDEVSIPLSKFGDLGPDSKFTIGYMNGNASDDYQFKDLEDSRFLHYANNSAKLFNLQDMDSQSLEISGHGIPGQKIKAKIEYNHDNTVKPIDLGETIVAQDGVFTLSLEHPLLGLKGITLSAEGEYNSFKRIIVTQRIDEYEELFVNNSFQMDDGLTGWFKQDDRGYFTKMDGHGNFADTSSLAQEVYLPPMTGSYYNISLMVRVNKLMLNNDSGVVYFGEVITQGGITSSVGSFEFNKYNMGQWKKLSARLPIVSSGGATSIGFTSSSILDMDVKDVSFSLSE